MQQEHQKREAARLACDKQKASVMKLIGKLAKPTKTEITDTAISLTIDRNKKLHGEVCSPTSYEHVSLMRALIVSPCHLKLRFACSEMPTFSCAAPQPQT